MDFFIFTTVKDGIISQELLINNFYSSNGRTLNTTFKSSAIF